MRNTIIAVLLATVSVTVPNTSQGQEPHPDIKPVSGRWSAEKANAWYDKQPWLVGCNYYPATAINQIREANSSVTTNLQRITLTCGRDSRLSFGKSLLPRLPVSSTWFGQRPKSSPEGTLFELRFARYVISSVTKPAYCRHAQ